MNEGVKPSKPGGVALRRLVSDIESECVDVTIALLTNVGITATRNGLTNAQCATLVSTLREIRTRRGGTIFHHGDCQGGDESGAEMARALGFLLVCHAPIKSGLRAWVRSDLVLDPLPYLARDRQLVAGRGSLPRVNAIDVLLGCPGGDEAAQTRSGTWYTIRCARELGTRLLVIDREGSVIERSGI